MSCPHATRLQIACLFVVTLVTHTRAGDLPVDTSDITQEESLQELKSWIPIGRTREAYVKYGGFSRDDWETNREQCFKIADIVNRNMQIPLNSLESVLVEDGPDPCLGDDQLFFGEQSKGLLQHLEALASEQQEAVSRDSEARDEEHGSREKRSAHSRKKRNSKLIRDSDQFKTNRWSLPIKYKLDGYLAAYGNGPIKEAIREWEQHTCVRFQQIEVDEVANEHHVVFLPTTSPICYSYIGKTDTKEEDMSQPIFLSRLCMSQGILGHEIGHTLGLIHEHQRPDRDEYIQIVTQNVKSSGHALFASIPTKFIDTRQVPYDYGSSMHYTKTAFSRNGLNTIQTSDPRYQNTIGQRVELSFWDTFAINTAYCADTCRGIFLPRKCSNHGYQNPNDCRRCKCPDGWRGDFCDLVAFSVGAPCGGRIELRSMEKRFIESPNYGRGPYENGQECTWVIEAPVGKRVIANFDGPFHVFCFDRCIHWVEIRSGEDLGLNGPRYCCDTTPTEPIVSEGNILMVTLRAKETELSMDPDRAGFRLSVLADGDECNPTPCWNSGSCIDGVANFTCVCKPRNFGRYCEHHDLIECASNPCLNGGTCLEGFGRFICECPYPWAGYRCQSGPPRSLPHLTSTTSTTTTTTEATTTTTTTTVATTTTTTPVRLTDPPFVPKYSPEDIIDLVFILDISSRDKKELGCLKGFLKSVIRRFDYGSSATRIGLMTIASLAHSESSLSAHTHQDGVLDDIANQKVSSYRYSNYYNAVWLLTQQTFLGRKGARPHVPHVAVLVTDNEPSEDHLSVFRGIKQNTVQKLRTQNIQVLAVGVGNYINTDELLIITGNESHIYHPRDCAELTSENATTRASALIRRIANEARQTIVAEQSTTPSTTTPTTTSPTTTTPSVQSSSQSTPTAQTTGRLNHILHTKPADRHQDNTTPQEPTPPPAATPEPVTSSVNEGDTPANRPSCDWEKQTNCSKTCGGCGRRMMIYVCDSSGGSKRTHFKLQEPCNFQPCPTNCQHRIGRRYESRPCGYCCAGFRIDSGVCVKTKP